MKLNKQIQLPFVLNKAALFCAVCFSSRAFTSLSSFLKAVRIFEDFPHGPHCLRLLFQLSGSI